MRKTFISAIVELAEKDQRILLLTGDLGYLLVEPYAEKFPSRFINVGVAEQNMIGLATGLAEAGFIPYVYSITPFAVLRPYEFIRNGPIHHNLKVRIVGGGSGFEYSHDGNSHFALDDIGVLRVQPGISIFAPADFEQAGSIFRKTWDLPGPIYYRLSKDEKSIIPGLSGSFEIGTAQVIGDGPDVLVVTLGSITNQAVQAIEHLKSKRIGCTLMVVASVQPAPLASFREILPRFRHVVTVEEHFINGGLGSLVAEFVADEDLDCKVTRCGVKVSPDGWTSGYLEILRRHNLSFDTLSQIIADTQNNQ